MNNLYPLEPSEMIYLLLDGELDASHSEVLFSALAGDEELRSFFNDTVTMNRAADIDARSIEAPLPDVPAIFASAGMTTAATSATVVTTPNFWTKYIPMMASAVAASLVTFALTLSLLPERPVDESSKLLPAENPRQTADSKAMLSPESSVPQQHTRTDVTIAPSKSAVQSSMSGQTVQYITQYIVMDNDAPSRQNPEKQEAMEKPLIESVAFLSLQRSAPTPFSENTGTFRTIAPPDVSVPEHDYPLIMQLRTLVGLGFANAPGIAPNPNSGSNNIALALYTAITPNNMLGVEFGQEEMLNFDEARSENKERFAAITYVAFAYRFALSAGNNEDTWKPFGQIMLGGSQLGGLLKAATGVEWKPLPSVGFTAGIESSIAQYWYSSKVQASNKTGVYGGILFHF